MSDENNLKPQDDTQPVNDTTPAEELAEDELNNVSGGITVRKAGKDWNDYKVTLDD